MTKEKLDITRPEIGSLVANFTDHSLPAGGWTHEAHLITGLWLILEHGIEQAEAMMPDMIKTFNEAKGGINSDTEGYHHTITIFYLRALEKFRGETECADDIDLVRLMLNNSLAKKMYPLKYYSKDRLFSTIARREYVEPDLLKLEFNE